MELLLPNIIVAINLLMNYLHSNMELLLPVDSTKKDFLIFEFTFQYGATSTYCISTHHFTFSNIYIPIWSYFYQPERQPYLIAFAFTFQYGATSTSLIEDFKFLGFTFTFQYGATSTQRID